ncbi:hypothetical protein A1354_03620 [Pseudomonas asplenii]|nr:hypothetical protein A1354_03620 [Pseudomonas asplenii]
MNCALFSPDANLPNDLGGQILIIKKVAMLAAVSWLLVGCGSVLTVLQDDADVARDMRKQKTYCQSIPHIYSGLAFDFCVLNAPPDPSGFLVPFVLLDLPLSAVFDTVALPYTVYRQVTDGNLGIYWRKGGY